MTFQNPLEENDCAQDYEASHLDYLCAIGNANDIEVEEAILANSLNKLGFDPGKQKKITIHIPSQLLEYGSDEPENSPQCGIDDSLILNREIDDVVLKFDHEFLEWEFFLKNSTIPDRPAKVTVYPPPEGYGIGGDAYEENMNINCLQLSFDTTDSSSSWRLQVSCGEDHWFDYVCCKISFPDIVTFVDSKTTLPTQVSTEEQVTPLTVLNLPVRVRNTCKRAGIISVEELAALSDEEILQIKTAGFYALKEIRKSLDIWRNST
jgi:hypothetical protein